MQKNEKKTGLRRKKKERGEVGIFPERSAKKVCKNEGEEVGSGATKDRKNNT